MQGYLQRHQGRLVAGFILLGCLTIHGASAQGQASRPTSNPRQQPQLVPQAVPVNPNDPIARVNGEVITRSQLADLCVARHGEEVLNTMIRRVLLEQAIRGMQLQVTAADVDAEILRHAQPYGLSKEQFLRALAQNYNISPQQYTTELAYPSIALRKIAERRVEVTDEDLEKAFLAYFGEKLFVRSILVPDKKLAITIWNQLRDDPGAFARLAREHSIDEQSRAMGGLLEQPIVRYAEPLNVSEAAFEQLVDGENLLKGVGSVEDSTLQEKPKDGDFTGVIELSSEAYIILRRERLEAGQEVDHNDPEIVTALKAKVFEAKVQNEMKTVMEGLFLEAAIDNQLTGRIKHSGQEQAKHRNAVTDDDVLRTRMSKPDQEIPVSDAQARQQVLQEYSEKPEVNLSRPIGAPAAPKVPEIRRPQPKSETPSTDAKQDDTTKTPENV